MDIWGSRKGILIVCFLLSKFEQRSLNVAERLRVDGDRPLRFTTHVKFHHCRAKEAAQRPKMKCDRQRGDYWFPCDLMQRVVWTNRSMGVYPVQRH